MGVNNEDTEVGDVSYEGETIFFQMMKNGDEKCPLFVNKQLFWWSASITLDDSNAVLTHL